MEDKFTANLQWPPEESEIKTIDQTYLPTGNVHQLTVKNFSFYSNPGAIYGGDSSQLNPEDLLLCSLSSCQFMTFFALAAKSRMGLNYYEDNSELFLGGDKIKFAEKIVLNLKMKFETHQEHEKVLELCHKAHKYCIIGNSIKAEILFNLELV